jgi:predicted nucleic acid-binding protein
MKPVFLDTVGLIALWDEADQWHMHAAPVFAALLAANRDMVTTTTILLECGNAAARKSYRQDVCDLRGRMLAHQDLVEPTAAEIERAWEDFAAGIAGNAGIVDCVSFAVMRRLGVAQAFSNDKHFTVAGFEVLF